MTGPTHRSLYDSYCQFTWRAARTLYAGHQLLNSTHQAALDLHGQVFMYTKAAVQGQPVLRHAFPDDHGVAMVVCYGYMAVAATLLPVVLRLLRFCWS